MGGNDLAKVWLQPSYTRTEEVRVFRAPCRGSGDVSPQFVLFCVQGGIARKHLQVIHFLYFTLRVKSQLSFHRNLKGMSLG